jgi:hypothetical protein
VFLFASFVLFSALRTLQVKWRRYREVPVYASTISGISEISASSRSVAIMFGMAIGLTLLSSVKSPRDGRLLALPRDVYKDDACAHYYKLIKGCSTLVFLRICNCWLFTRYAECALLLRGSPACISQLPEPHRGCVPVCSRLCLDKTAVVCIRPSLGPLSHSMICIVPCLAPSSRSSDSDILLSCAAT